MYRKLDYNGIATKFKSVKLTGDKFNNDRDDAQNNEDNGRTCDNVNNFVAKLPKINIIIVYLYKNNIKMLQKFIMSSIHSSK